MYELFNPHNNSMNRYYYVHLTDEKINTHIYFLIRLQSNFTYIFYKHTFGNRTVLIPSLQLGK